MNSKSKNSKSKNAARWAYTQQSGYFECGPFDSDGDWRGYSVGVEPLDADGEPTHSNLSGCVQGRGDTLEEAIDDALT
jgi:hypothetical protein